VQTAVFRVAACYAPFVCIGARLFVGTSIAMKLCGSRSKGYKVRPKVLIIDDDAAIRQQLFWSLCDDYDVMTAEDMPSAIRRVTVYEPHVSLLDLHLPPVPSSTLTGLRILEYLKAHCPRALVFVVSSDDNAETQAACFAGGADGFLSKPLDVEQLHATLRQTAYAQQLEMV